MSVQEVNAREEEERARKAAEAASREADAARAAAEKARREVEVAKQRRQSLQSSGSDPLMQLFDVEAGRATTPVDHLAPSPAAAPVRSASFNRRASASLLDRASRNAGL